MGDTSITVNGYTFTFNGGDIEQIKSTIVSKKSTNEITGKGPAACYNYDNDGATKLIVIKGQLTEADTTRVSGYTVTTKLAQKQWLESLINGNQSSIILTEDYEGQSVLQSSGATAPYNGSFTSTVCMVAQIEFERNRGDPNQIPFTLTMEVGR